MNAGQQIVKSNPDTAGGGVDDGIVEYSALGYTTTSRDAYTNGVDVLGGGGGRSVTICSEMFVHQWASPARPSCSGVGAQIR